MKIGFSKPKDARDTIFRPPRKIFPNDWRTIAQVYGSRLAALGHTFALGDKVIDMPNQTREAPLLYQHRRRPRFGHSLGN